MFSDENELQGQTRKEAIADAQTRAEELARLAGVELGEVHSVSESIGPWPMNIMVDRGLGGGFAPSELEFSTQVQVTFAIR